MLFSSLKQYEEFVADYEEVQRERDSIKKELYEGIMGFIPVSIAVSYLTTLYRSRERFGRHELLLPLLKYPLVFRSLF